MFSLIDESIHTHIFTLLSDSSWNLILIMFLHELTYTYKCEVASVPDETIDDQVSISDWGGQPRGALDSFERDAKPRGHARRVHGSARDGANACPQQDYGARPGI